MAKRYELPDAAWELIEYLFSREQKMDRPRHDDRLMLNGILWVCASVLPGATCRSASAHDRRCISAFVTGGTAACSIKYLSVCISA